LTVASVMSLTVSKLAFNELCYISHEYLFAVFRTPYEMTRYLVGEMFGMPFFHTKHYSILCYNIEC
jgi:hypothetical protein